MTNQLPLLDRSGRDLPSPQFRPRPGWGGRVREWLRDNLYLLIFRTVLVIALIWLANTLVPAWRARVAQSPTPTPTPAFIERTALAGQGMTHLAAGALDEYLAGQSVRLDPAEHLFAVDSLARGAGWRLLDLGERIVFALVDIIRTVISAKVLTPAQHAAWGNLLK